MTEAPIPPDDALPDMTAAELALGLLEGEERTAALRRTLGDRAFASEVERWRAWLGPMAESAIEVAPPPDLLPRIDASIDGRPTAPQRGRFWPIATAISGLAAAILLVLLISRPTPPPPRAAPIAAPAPLLAASIQPSGAGAAIVALYDPTRATIRLGASPVTDAAHSAELWVIAGKAPPRPLGLMAGAASQLAVASGVNAALTPGATLAISRESAGGSTTGAPTGPVIATGVLAPV